MRIAIFPILANAIRTMMTMRAIDSQPIIEKKVSGKQSSSIPSKQGSLVPGG